MIFFNSTSTGSKCWIPQETGHKNLKFDTLKCRDFNAHYPEPGLVGEIRPRYKRLYDILL